MRARVHTAVQAAGVMVAALAMLGLTARVVASSAWPLLPVALLLGLLLGDVLSGLVHWACDTFFEESTPVIGALFIAPFRDHHRDPLGITRHGFLERNGNNCLAVLPALALGLFGALPALLQALVLCTCVALVLTNELHAFAHRSQRPRLVAWLQRRGLILPPEHHALHHSGAQRGGYCVTTGWCNLVLDRWQVFARAERWLRGLSRVVTGP